MNLKEYLFYTQSNASEFADVVQVSQDYMRRVIRGDSPLSKRFAYTIELVTKGVVKRNEVLGPPSHPEAKKILESSIDS